MCGILSICERDFEDENVVISARVRAWSVGGRLAAVRLAIAVRLAVTGAHVQKREIRRWITTVLHLHAVLRNVPEDLCAKPKTD